MASTSASRSRAELAFLPAALEIVETPPSPIGRAISVTVVALTGLAVAWASVGTVDIVSIAPGKIIPTGRTKLVQPLDAVFQRFRIEHVALDEPDLAADDVIPRRRIANERDAIDEILLAFLEPQRDIHDGRAGRRGWRRGWA